jgi:hypothetical protein
VVLLIALALTAIAAYLRLKLTEEVESLAAGLVACLGLFFSLFFAPLLIKLGLLIILIAPQLKYLP